MGKKISNKIKYCTFESRINIRVWDPLSTQSRGISSMKSYYFNYETFTDLPGLSSLIPCPTPSNPRRSPVRKHTKNISCKEW